LTLNWNEKYTSRTFKKNDHSNVNIISFHCLHLKCVLCQNAIDLQDDHQISCDVCVNHLTRVVRTFEQRRRHDDEIVKMQQQCLRMINDNFKAMSTQILEIEIYVKFIQLHLTHLQIKFRQHIKNKQHDALIFNFCNRIKNRFAISRDKRRRRVVKTSNERKQKWSIKFKNEMQKSNKMKKESMKKTWHKLFRVKWQQSWNVYQIRNRRRVCETLTKNISSKRLTLHKVLFKSENALIIHMQTKCINLANYLFFRRVSTMLTSSCICDYSRQTLKHVLLFCNDRATNKQSMFKKDEMTNLRKLVNIEKKL
jgi:hypothetical protein